MLALVFIQAGLPLEIRPAGFLLKEYFQDMTKSFERRPVLRAGLPGAVFTSDDHLAERIADNLLERFCDMGLDPQAEAESTAALAPGAEEKFARHCLPKLSEDSELVIAVTHEDVIRANVQYLSVQNPEVAMGLVEHMKPLSAYFMFCSNKVESWSHAQPENWGGFAVVEPVVPQVVYGY